jgi:hypothetical protein
VRTLLRVATALAGLAVVVELARRLTAPPDHPAVAVARPSGPATATGAPRAGSVVAQPTSIAGHRLTRQELYDEARRLDITGRSGMSKAQLSRAVTEAKEGRP